MKGFSCIKSICTCLAAGLLLTGCAYVNAPFKPPTGLIVTSVKAPLQLNYPEKGVEVARYSGSASSYYIHDCLLTGMNIGWDKCSIDQAACNGNITNVQYADYSSLIILGIFAKTTITVYGDSNEDQQP